MTVERIRRMCKRTGCTETWDARPSDGKRYCRSCIPQSSSGPKYPFKMQRQCACGVKQIKMIHSEQERLAPFECKSCIDASTNYKWHEMQLLYLVMMNEQCTARDFVRQGVFKDWNEYDAFCKFLRDVMQIDLHRKVDRTGGWSWGSLAKEHSIVKHKGTSVHGQSELSTLKDYLEGILNRNKKSLEEE